jgi:timeless
MNSLKTEFRRGSSKLVASDRLQYFHLVWFLTTYHRAKIQHLKCVYDNDLKKFKNNESKEKPTRPEYHEKAILSTLDMFSFNFVLQSIEVSCPKYASIKNNSVYALCFVELR